MNVFLKNVLFWVKTCSTTYGLQENYILVLEILHIRDLFLSTFYKISKITEICMLLTSCKKIYWVLLEDKMYLPIHWLAEGRKRVVPIPVVIEAKTSDAPHLTVEPVTFFPRSLTFSALSILSIFSSKLIIQEKNRQISTPTWTNHNAAIPRKCPAKKI